MRASYLGGRKSLRNALDMPALVATRFNPGMAAKHEQPVRVGKPKKPATTAVVREIVVLANAVIKADRKWAQRKA